MKIIDGHYGQNRIPDLELDENRRLSKIRVGGHTIRRNDIEAVTEISRTERGGGGSVVGGAIVGGLIAGETGAIIGGLAGGQEARKTHHIVLVRLRNGLQFNAECSSEEYQLLISAATFKGYERLPEKVDWQFLGGTKSQWDFLADQQEEREEQESPETVRPTQVKCPHCRGAVENEPALAGEVVACPYCEGQFRMPPPPEAIV